MTKVKPRVLMKSRHRVEFVMDGVCRYYNIDRQELLRRARTGLRFKRKRMAIKILRDEAECSFKDIQYAFGNTGPNNCWVIYQGICEDIDSRNYHDKELKKEYEDILRFLEI
jgi:hypothetical protein